MSKANGTKKTVLLSDIFEAVRTSGLQDKRTLDVYHAWIEQVQPHVEKADTAIARVKLEITCAEIYLEIDMPAEAKECFQDALYQANQERLSAVATDLTRALQTILLVAKC